ncbi:MAG: hypothetical protein PUB22_02850 [Clostridiales bacterium]|nr:hypothetical protein [Clostridiales bacterium]
MEIINAEVMIATKETRQAKRQQAMKNRSKKQTAGNHRSKTADRIQHIEDDKPKPIEC